MSLVRESPLPEGACCADGIGLSRVRKERQDVFIGRNGGNRQGFEFRRWNVIRLEREIALAIAFIGEEKEHFVLDDRPSGGPSKLVETDGRFIGRRCQQGVASIEHVVLPIL